MRQARVQRTAGIFDIMRMGPFDLTFPLLFPFPYGGPFGLPFGERAPEETDEEAEDRGPYPEGGGPPFPKPFRWGHSNAQ